MLATPHLGISTTGAASLVAYVSSVLRSEGAPLDCIRPCALRRRERQSMTDRTLSISAALREAQLQRLEASLASKAVAKPQAQTEVFKDKDAKARN